MSRFNEVRSNSDGGVCSDWRDFLIRQFCKYHESSYAIHPERAGKDRNES